MSIQEERLRRKEEVLLAHDLRLAQIYVFLMHNYSCSKIAEIMDISESAVRNLKKEINCISVSLKESE